MAYDRTLKHFVSAFELAPLWQSGTVYALNQLVVYNKRLYSCALAHTAGGSFETDHAAGDWLEVSSGTTVWASGTYYELNQFVEQSDQLYQCIVAHTAGTFATDLSSGKWVGLLPGQTVPISLGGTGQTTQTAAFDALAPTTTAGDLIVRGASNNVRVGIGSDGQVLVADSAQTNKLKWATIQQGSKNYISNSTFENGVTPPSSWSAFNATIDATTKVPSGAISSDSTFTLATSSSTPLAGTYSMTATTSGTVTITTTGRGFISDAFTIDREDQAKVMQFSFYYEAITNASGMNFSGSSSNTFAIYAYDVTNSTWIQPAGVYNMTQGSGVGLASGTFQTSATGTQYRLAVIMISSVTGALSVKFDDFRLGPQTVVYGSPITDWEDLALTSNWTTNTNLTSKSRRVGEVLEVQFSLSITGTPTNADLLFQLPSQYVVDTTALLNSSGASRGGHGWAEIFDASAATDNYFRTVWWRGDVNGFKIKGVTSNGSVTPAPIAYANGDKITGTVFLPIQGWSSSVQMSNDTDTRVVAMIKYSASASGTVASTFAGSTDISFGAADYDTHGTFNGTTYTIPVSGYYSITATTQVSSTGVSAGLQYTYIALNGAALITQYLRIADTLNTNRMVTASGASYLKAGDLITVRAAANTTTPTLNASASLVVQRISGPATIAASETVVARYVGTTGATITNGSVNIVDFSTIDQDTHGAVTTGASWKFTAPISGFYSVSAQIRTSAYAMTAATNFIELDLYKNGAIATVLTFETGFVTTSVRREKTGTTVLYLNAGDYIDLRVNNGSGSASFTLDTSNTHNWISIAKV